MIRSRPKFHAISKAITGAAVFCLGQAASAQEIAPYFHSWGGSLMDAKNAAGMDSAILAFAITDGNCALTSSLLDKLPDARNYMAAGGRLLISFGGTEGVYAEEACRDDNQLFTLMERLMLDAGTRRFDFDIEGNHVGNVDATARRARVLARLQAKYPDLSVTLSLPGWLNGFSPEGLNLLNMTVAAGVRIETVVVMAQSFGIDNLNTMVTPPTVGQGTIVTFRAAANQVAAIYRDKTPAQLHAMMGVTPMIGRNDDGSTFTLDDARAVAEFVKANGIGLVSYWSFQRDRAQAGSGAGSIQAFSNVAQSDFQYHAIFKSVGGSVAAAQPVSACGYSTWVINKPYAAGSVVTYSDGKLYRAKFANPGYIPTVSTYYWADYTCG